MSMSKKHFIALADTIKEHNNLVITKIAGTEFNQEQLKVLASFCLGQNSNFMAGRWFAYINGECGPNGGKVKT